LPTSAESFVKLHNAQEFFQTDLGEVELGLKEIAVGIQGIELSIDPTAIS